MNPTLPTYFLQIMQGQLSAVLVLMAVLNCLREAEFLMELSRRSRNLDLFEL